MASVLFVCLGNICRSPAGEGVFKAIVEREGGARASTFRVDSCGTGGGAGGWYKEGGWSYHTGEAADSRISKEAKKRGYKLTSHARTLTADDIKEFDYIIVMEDKNRVAVLEAAEYWGGAALRELAKQKTSMMTAYCTKFTTATRVPDPWYEGGFDNVLDLLEDACEGLYNHIAKENQ